MIGDPLHETMHAYLIYLESIKICQGMGRAMLGANDHPILRWDGEKVVFDTLHRSPECSILINNNSSVCVKCTQFSSQDEVLYEVTDATEEDPIKGVFEDEHRSLNEWQLMFYSNQVKNASLPAHQRRYHPDTIRWAIELYSRSPAAYDHIRTSNVLILPSSSTIRRYRNYLTPKPGLCEMALCEIERVMKEHRTLPGYLTLDEMKIKENVVVRDGQLI
uniref:uncharacterized protein LOC120335785 n=1 Tax=Styela clava TaxID=7725 RepID=UPI0019397C5B|nr:uncharacterized protein LOC120335785 [Styela clava]